MPEKSFSRSESKSMNNPSWVGKVKSRTSPTWFGKAKSRTGPSWLRKLKKKALGSFPYLLTAYAVNKIFCFSSMVEGKTRLLKIINASQHLKEAFLNPFPSLRPVDLLAGLVGAATLWALVRYKKANAKKFRLGEEHGSARWGTHEEIEPFMDPDFRNNIILTQTEGLRLNGKPRNVRYERNKNVLVIGAAGTGKTRFFVKPQLMQMNSSYVVTDPKGQVVVECGKMLLNGGYKLKIFNLVDTEKSLRYNPFMYIHSEKDILSFVNALITNTKGKGAQAGEDFWIKCEAMYLTALIAYIWYEAPTEEQNFEMLLDLLDASEVREEDEDYQSDVDLLFEELAERNPRHFAVRQYRKFKQGAGKTAKSILISCSARLAPFDIEELRDLTSRDELEIDRLGEEKTALFIIISDTDDTYNFLVSVLYSQMMNVLCEKSYQLYNGRLPYHVRMILDEFSNIGQIPNFSKVLSVIRSRNISASIVIQSKAALKAAYDKEAEAICDNCESTLFLGGNSMETLKDMEERLGKETIDSYNVSDTRGMHPSYSTTFQKMGRSLLTKDQVSVMDGSKCLLFIRGVNPFLSDKYDITGHPMYGQLSDANPDNALDVARYVSNYGKPRIHLDEKVDVFEDLGILDDDEVNEFPAEVQLI